MGLFIGNAMPSKVFVGGQQYSKVFVGSTQVRPTGPAPVSGEYIEYVMTADENGTLYVPTGGIGTNDIAGCSYDWNIYVNNQGPIHFSGTGSSGSKLTLGGYSASTDYSIKIVPVTEAYQRARAYGWYNNTASSYLKSITHDETYMGFAVSATDTGLGFRYREYQGCANLRNRPAEVLPNTVTTVGQSFRNAQYRGCTSLTSSPSEVFPDTITSIGNFFRYEQYRGCSSLTSAGTEKLSNSMTTIPQDFRGRQYQETAITTTPIEAVPSSITTIGNYYRNHQYYSCASLNNVRFTAFATGGADYRIYQIYDISYNTTITISGNVVDYTGGHLYLNIDHVDAIYVPNALLSSYQNSSNWSYYASKFIGY